MKNLINKKLGFAMIGMALTGSMLVTRFAAAKEEKVFYPFRSYLVSYVTSHARDNDINTCRQWMRLFYEETHYNSGEYFYDSEYDCWSAKYYSNYIDENKIMKSSKGVTVTYNPDFDFFVGQTLGSNEYFLGELAQNADARQVLDNYLTLSIDYEDVTNIPRPYITDGITSITRAGAYIGTGKTDENNQVRKYQLDDKLLRIFVANWDKLSNAQKNWVKSYDNELCQDYIACSGQSKALASKDERPELYDVMARSNHGANSEYRYQKEFFDYIVSTDNGLGAWLSQVKDIDKDFSTDKLKTAKSVEDIFAGKGYSIHEVGPENMDYFAYYIAFKRQIDKEPWLRINQLMTENERVNHAMEPWKERYYELHKPKLELDWDEEATVSKNDMIFVAIANPLITGHYKTIDSDIDTILVNGAKAKIDETKGTFSCQLPSSLEDSIHTPLSVKLVDKTDNETLVQTTLVYDGTPPEVEMELNEDNSEANPFWSNKKDATFVGKAQDFCVGIRDNIVYVELTTGDKIELVEARVDENNQFSVPVTLSEEEVTKIELYAMDELKNTSQKQVRYAKADESAPQIEFDDGDEINIQTVNDLPNFGQIKGRVFDNNSGLKRFSIGGKACEVDDDGRFSFGKYFDTTEYVEFEAEDVCGNIVKLRVKVNLDSIQAHKNFPDKPQAKMSGGINGNNNAKYSDDYHATANAWNSSSTATFKGRITGDMQVINCTNKCYGTNGDYAHEQSKITLQVRSAIDDSVVDTQVMYDYFIRYNDTKYTISKNTKNPNYEIPEKYKNGLYYYSITSGYGSTGVEQGGWHRVTLIIYTTED